MESGTGLVYGVRYTLDTTFLSKLYCRSSPPQKSHFLMIYIYIRYPFCGQIHQELICMISSVTLRFFEVYGARYKVDTKSPGKLICPSSCPPKSHLLMIQIYTRYLSCKRIRTKPPLRIDLQASSPPKSQLLMIQIYTGYFSCGQIHQELICTISLLSRSACKQLHG